LIGREITKTPPAATVTFVKFLFVVIIYGEFAALTVNAPSDPVPKSISTLLYLRETIITD
jgi:hypothetical protein